MCPAGEFTYCNDADDPAFFETRNVLYPAGLEKLIIGSMGGLAALSAEHNELASALGNLQAMCPDDRAVLVVCRARAWLAARGVRAGDVVALCAPDSFDMAVTRYVISFIGAVAVTLSPLSSRRDLFARLCGSGARWLITTCDLFVQKLEVAARPTAVMQTFLTGSAVGDAKLPGALRFDVLDPYGEAAVRGDDLRVGTGG
jgi:hypothetical protein